MKKNITHIFDSLLYLLPTLNKHNLIWVCNLIWIPWNETQKRNELKYNIILKVIEDKETMENIINYIIEIKDARLYESLIGIYGNTSQ